MKDLLQAYPSVDPARRHQPAGSPGTEVTVGGAPRPPSDSGSAHSPGGERDLEPALLPVTGSLMASAKRPEDMHRSRTSLLPIYPRPSLILSWILFVGLSGCGQAPSENIPNLESSARPGELPLAQQNLSPQTAPVASAARPAVASPAPHASGNGTGQVEDRASSKPVTSKEPSVPQNALEVPAWFTKDLASPYVETRLRALDIWVASAPVGSIDPLILAYGTDDDERVQARAMELIEQDWARAAEAGQ